jgi:hypothetical protein
MSDRYAAVEAADRWLKIAINVGSRAQLTGDQATRDRASRLINLAWARRSREMERSGVVPRRERTRARRTTSRGHERRALRSAR